VPRPLLTTDLGRVLADPETSIAVELWGGIEPARTVSLQLLEAGKHLVTANKALLAEHGPEIFDRAHELDRSVAFEASVAGGIPIIAAVGQSLSANQIVSITGILNGTTNYILTQMSETGQSYAVALRRAQELGYAEPDPALDVNGTDTAHKLAILAQLGFGCRVSTATIVRQGIDQVDAADIRFATELGYAIKLLAVARLSHGAIELRVGPTLVRHHSPLAEVRGAYNAIQVVGDAVGDTLFYGRGAGQMPTASAVVADIIDTATGRARIAFQTLRLWSENGAALPILPPEQVNARYYLRFSVEDQPGVLGQIAQVLGGQRVSIASVIQHEAQDDDAGAVVPLVIMTHSATEASVSHALRCIDALPAVLAPSVCMRVL
jgi:homoserine dehydrogenase